MLKKNFFYKKKTKKQTNKQKSYYQDNIHINMFTLVKSPSHPVAFSFPSKLAFMVEIIMIIIIIIIIKIIIIIIIVLMYKSLLPVFIFSKFLEEMIN